jgi:choline dehydrogenase-like flavoprotein
MRIAPTTERLLSNGSKELMRVAQELGCPMQLLPKFIDPKACRKCGNCVLGCIHGAKWTAREYLDEATENGAGIVYETQVKEVIFDKGKARGVKVVNGQDPQEIFARGVILAAGGIGTPVILLNSGIKDAGAGLFVDLFVNTYGITDDDKLNQVFEPVMTMANLDFHQTKGFLLSPFVNHPRLSKFVELGLKGLTLPDNRTLGIMTKTIDEPVGKVFPDGSISKPVTEKDRIKLREGSRLAKEILAKAGAKSIAVSRVQGAHPGGTAAIGKVVDKDLQTKVEGLFVGDASVLPQSPGLPPILTIVALARRLGRALP